MAGSAVPALVDHLLEVLFPAVLPSGVTTCYGLPVDGQPADLVMIGMIRVASQEPVLTSHRPVEEEISVQLLISSVRQGVTAQVDAMRAAFGHYDAIRAHLRTPGSEVLGGTGARVARLTLGEVVPDIYDGDVDYGRLSQVEATLLVRARQPS